MPEPHGRAHRKGGPRSRVGCRNCKARHMKCDETKPSCRRCLEKGEACDGYPAVNIKSANTALTASSVQLYAIPFRVPGSQNDRQLLHFFCVQGATELSGYLTSEFWTRLVMQRSHACLPVRQATVALSSAHRSYAVACGPLDHNAAATEAIVYYNRAMRSLRKYLNATINNKQDVSLVIPLICSILFFCFEITQGNTYNALQHLDGGIEILNRCKKEKLPAYNNPDYGDLNILCQILARLDLQATMFDDCRRPKIRLLDGMDMTASSYKCFETIYDAQTDLTRLQHRLMHLLISNEDLKFRSFHELPEHVILEKRAIGEVFDQWSEKADQFVYEKQAAHQQDEQYTNAHDTCVNGDVQAQDVALAVLRVQHQLFHLCLAASLPYDSTVFDLQGRESSYRHTLNTVLDMAESALAQNHACGVGNRPLAAETGIVAPLFYIIMKCTDSDIVEKARKLLVASGRREGLFDSRMVVAIAERIVSQNELPEILIAPGASALEWQAGDALEKREMGLAGVAKNLGVIP